MEGDIKAYVEALIADAFKRGYELGKQQAEENRDEHIQDKK